jgi:methionyl aminopeptidase
MTVGSQAELAGLREVGRLVGLAIAEMRRAVRAGMTTAELDEVGARFLRAHGARSAPQLTYDFPGFTCISVNEEVVHGVPGARVLAPRDVVKIDVSAELDGYIADAAVTVVIPPVTADARKLRRCAEVAFERAMAVARAGARLSEIGRAVENEVQRRGFSVLRELSGHGVGRQLHEDPSVPNYYSPLTRGTLRAGMVLAVEPLIAAQPSRLVDAPDGWTVRTQNRALAAHHEHTVLITSGAPVILTEGR